LARIALDAMGGDNAPTETVAGAVEASQRGVDVVLVGDHVVLEAELAKHETRLPIVDAPEVIGMSDDPARSLREKPGASITVAAKLVAEGTADGLVSAGSTGAAMAAAAIIIGRIKGVSRPSIASLFPTPGSPTLVLDSGANPDVKPDQLAQFGIMGSVAVQVMLGLDHPRVGLLSNGEEKGKGRDLERAAYDLLDSSNINFIGNVEGRDIATDRAGVRFGETAVKSATAQKLQMKVGAGIVEKDFMPATADLPEFMTEAEFKRRFGGVDGAEYKKMMAEIERRVAALALYR